MQETLDRWRVDVSGQWHAVTETPCDECGCSVFVAVDGPTIVWEPGPNFGPSCRDRACTCHRYPLRGN